MLVRKSSAIVCSGWQVECCFDEDTFIRSVAVNFQHLANEKFQMDYIALIHISIEDVSAVRIG
jgi:hypothetical protein